MKGFFKYIQQPVDYISKFPKIGKKTIEAMRENRCWTVWDLLVKAPKKILELSYGPLSHEEQMCLVRVQVLSAVRSKGRIKHILTLQDEYGNKGKILVTSKNIPFKFEIGQWISVFGKCKFKTFLHPKLLTEQNDQGEYIIAQYFLKTPLFDSKMQEMIKGILAELNFSIPDFLKKHLQSKHQTWKEFFFNLHFGNRQQHTDILQDLSFLESAGYQVLMQKMSVQKNEIEMMQGIGSMYNDTFEQLKQTLTSCQSNALKEIEHDFKKPLPSRRMIFGDVGTGKTRVVILASMFSLSIGKNVLILAPTTVLAKQLFAVFSQTLRDSQIMLHLGNGLVENNDVEGACAVHIGTHALFEREALENVGLIVIDEQHKFGVHQRLKLIERFETAHLLSLSATPIPRSLMLVLQNYMSVSLLKKKPKDTVIKTVLLSENGIDDLENRLQEIIDKKRLVYWICPAVSDDDEELDYMNVNQRFESLQGKYGDVVGLMHGQMKKAEQEEVYQKALAGEVSILVATTIVEVGVDIGHAKVMIVEDAQRFGLAQMHQLRGRVGRDGEEGVCVLVHKKRLSDVAKARLKAMLQFSTGFELADKDLGIRGFGDLFGKEQTGFLEMRFGSVFDTVNMNYAAKFLKESVDTEEKYFIDNLSACFFDSSVVDAG